MDTTANFAAFIICETVLLPAEFIYNNNTDWKRTLFTVWLKIMCNK